MHPSSTARDRRSVFKCVIISSRRAFNLSSLFGCDAVARTCPALGLWNSMFLDAHIAVERATTRPCAVMFRIMRACLRPRAGVWRPALPGTAKLTAQVAAYSHRFHGLAQASGAPAHDDVQDIPSSLDKQLPTACSGCGIPLQRQDPDQPG
jgi:hypothetical protein